MPGADENLENKGTGANGSENAEGGAPTAGSEGQGTQSKEMTSEEMKAEIAKLRKENASRRTTSKNLEDQLKGNNELVTKVKAALGITTEDEKPEVVVARLKDQTAALELEVGIRDLAIQNAIPGEHLKYFGFLFREQLEALSEGEELDGEKLSGIVNQVKGLSGAKKASSGAGSGAASETPPPGGAGEVDLTRFTKMNVGERGDLYRTNPALYNRLFSEAKQKKLL